MSDTDTFLEHFGIPGMRWGRRKSSDGTYASSGKKAKGERSPESQEVVKIQQKTVQSMTNNELKIANTRLQLEKTYADLNPAVVTKGQKFTKNSIGYFKTVKEVASVVKDTTDAVKAVKAALEEKKNPTVKK